MLLCHSFSKITCSIHCVCSLFNELSQLTFIVSDRSSPQILMVYSRWLWPFTKKNGPNSPNLSWISPFDDQISANDSCWHLIPWQPPARLLRVMSREGTPAASPVPPAASLVPAEHQMDDHGLAQRPVFLSKSGIYPQWQPCFTVIIFLGKMMKNNEKLMIYWKTM